MATYSNKFVVAHFLYPLATLVILSLVVVCGDVDRRLADFLYALQGDRWAFKNAWLAEHFFHKGGRDLSILLAVLLSLLLIASPFSRFLNAHKKPLLFLFIATAGSSLLIVVLKPLLAVSCPWEFARYGGQLPYAGVVEQLFLRNGQGCFPAGHASAGYAWISCYFFGLHYQSKWRWLGLLLPLGAGVIFGAVQQMRGAHFISHDLWSLALCWFFSLGIFIVFFKFPTEKLVGRELLCP